MAATQQLTDSGDVNFEHVVGKSTLRDGGYAGKLLTLIGNHLDESISKNRITQSMAGEIYSTGLAKVIQEAMGFELQDKLTEAKIATERKQIELADSKILTDASQIRLDEAELLIKEKQLILMDRDIDLKYAELALKENQLLIQQQELLIRIEELEIKKQELLIKEQELAISIRQLAKMDQEILNLQKEVEVMTSTIAATTQDIQNKLKQVEVLEADINLKEEKLTYEEAVRSELLPQQVAKEQQQSRLYYRQVLGFEDHRKSKIEDKLMESWGILYSSLPTQEALPVSLNAIGTDSVITNMTTRLTTNIIVPDDIS